MTDIERQRVLVAGDYGTLKTGFLIQLAVNNPDQPCFAFDTQDKFETVASIFGGIPDNLTVEFTPGIEEANAFMRDTVTPVLQGQPRGYGIVMVDMYGELWGSAQEYMADILASVGTNDDLGIGSNLDKQRAALIKAGKDAATGGFDGFSGHWQTIRGWYNFTMRNLMMKLRPHVFVTANTRPIKASSSDKGKSNPKKDKEDIQSVWGSFGAAPEGEKNLTGWVDTCLGIDVIDTDKLRQFKLSVLKGVTPDGSLFNKQHHLDAGKLKFGDEDAELIDYWKVYCDAVSYAPHKLTNPVKKESK